MSRLRRFGATLQTMTATVFSWLADPVDPNWNNPANWSPVGRPTQNDVAVFNRSTKREIEVNGWTEVSGLVFTDAYFRFHVRPEGTFDFSGVTDASSVTPEFVLDGGLNQNGGHFFVKPKAVIRNARFVVNGREQGNAGQLYVYGRIQDSKLYSNAGGNIVIDSNGAVADSTILSKPGIRGMLGGQIYLRGNASVTGTKVVLSGPSSYLQVQDYVGSIDVSHLSGQGIVWLGANEIRLQESDFSGTFEGGLVRFGSVTSIRVPNVTHLTGSAVLGGALEVYLPSGSLSSSYPLIEIAGARLGSFTSLRVHGLARDVTPTLEFAGNVLTLRISP